MTFYFSHSKAEALLRASKSVWFFDKKILESNYEQMINVLGTPFCSEIFLHESNIYIMAREELIKKGIECLQVYDAFFVRKSETSQEEVYSIIKECAQSYYQNVYLKFFRKEIYNH